jgi:hypothetical protein
LFVRNEILWFSIQEGCRLEHLTSEPQYPEEVNHQRNVTFHAYSPVSLIREILRSANAIMNFNVLYDECQEFCPKYEEEHPTNS